MKKTILCLLAFVAVAALSACVHPNDLDELSSPTPEADQADQS